VPAYWRAHFWLCPACVLDLNEIHDRDGWPEVGRLDGGDQPPPPPPEPEPERVPVPDPTMPQMITPPGWDKPVPVMPGTKKRKRR
jgi:hypothetical protein